VAAGWGQHGSLVMAPWSRQQQPAVASLAAVCSRSVASKTQVGFTGVGNMGNPMAKNLMKHGYPLIIYDVFPDACKEFLDAREQVVSSPADVAEKADRIITVLPTSINAIEAYSGANGILKKVKKGSLLIDSSTIDPMVLKELAKEVEKMGAVFMDARFCDTYNPVPGVTDGVPSADNY
uniref:3-hydroxyisobutyrate dehydrogenase n=1 Tax=Monodon monoceros TaxID=40151 RepID=A0A8C6BTW8_MONMO